MRVHCYSLRFIQQSKATKILCFYERWRPNLTYGVAAHGVVSFSGLVDVIHAWGDGPLPAHTSGGPHVSVFAAAAPNAQCTLFLPWSLPASHSCHQGLSWPCLFLFVRCLIHHQLILTLWQKPRLHLTPMKAHLFVTGSYLTPKF